MMSTSPVMSAFCRAVTSLMVIASTVAKWPTSGIPVILRLLQECAHAGIVLFQLVGAGAIAIVLPGDLAVRSRLDDGELIVGENEREIGIAARQLDDEALVAVGFDILDVRHDRLGRRFRLFAAMMIERCDDVGGSNRRAIVEHGIAKLERPLLRAIRAFPALGEIAMQFVVGSDDRQFALDIVGQHDRKAVLVSTRLG